MEKKRIELDSSAILYPYVGTKNITHGYVMEADLDTEIDPALLREVAAVMSRRFPSMFVVLGKDAFGYYLEHLDDGAAFVMPRPKVINKAFPIRVGEKLIRITYLKNRLGIEYFHSVTDGSGAITLLKSLMAEYFRRLGENIPNECGVLSPEEAPRAEELEDAFKKNYRKESGKESRSGKRAFQAVATGAPEPWHYTELSMSASELKTAAKAHGATITEYIMVLYILAFYRMREKHGGKKPITMSIPINLRSMFGSGTLRNFSLFFLTGLPEGEVTFENILKKVKKDFKNGMDKDTLQRMININVAQQSMALFRYLPRGLKKVALRTGFTFCGECFYTSTLSNLGVFKVPPELQKHVLMFRAILGPIIVNHIHTTAYCTGDTFALMFTSRLPGREIENTMRELFKEQGIQTKTRDEEELLEYSAAR